MFWDYSRGSIQSVSTIALISPRRDGETRLRRDLAILDVSRSIDRPSNFTTAKTWGVRSTRGGRRGSSRRWDRVRSVWIRRRRSCRFRGCSRSSGRGATEDCERLVCRSSAECARVTIGGSRADCWDSGSRKSTPCPRRRPSLRVRCRWTACTSASPSSYLQIKSVARLKEATGRDTQDAGMKGGGRWREGGEEASLSNFLPRLFASASVRCTK